MKTRDQIYGQEAASILRDISMYRVLKEEQLLRLYPGKQSKVKNLLDYLLRQGRIFRNGDLYCATPEQAEQIDQGLLAAVWVLVDLIDDVEYHSIGDYPTKIIFFANGEVYEVIHAACEKETLVNYVLAGAKEDPPKYIILVDQPEQIAELHIPAACGYCTVSPDGNVQYFRKEEERVLE
jgi:hypothetical protein